MLSARVVHGVEAPDMIANTPHLEIEEDADGRRPVVHDVAHHIVETNRYERSSIVNLVRDLPAPVFVEAQP
jgi:hypothetical protein